MRPRIVAERRDTECPACRQELANGDPLDPYALRLSPEGRRNHIERCTKNLNMVLVHVPTREELKADLEQHVEDELKRKQKDPTEALLEKP